MALYYIIILALIQGITEFLPISSSGHLVLFHEFVGGSESERWGENLMMDVAVHVGTLASVMVYFRRDVYAMLCGLKNFVTGNRESDNAKLTLYVLISSLPVIFVGLALYKLSPEWLRSIEVMAWATLIFGVLLWWVDSKKPTERSIESLTMRDALVIGFAQTLALIPGTSRSGITMTAGRYLGFTRSESARYSLLLAMVAISGAGALTGLDLVENGNMQLTLDVGVAAFLSFVSGLIAVTLMMRWLEKASFTVFAAYRVILGLSLLALIYSGTLA